MNPYQQKPGQYPQAPYGATPMGYPPAQPQAQYPPSSGYGAPSGFPPQQQQVPYSQAPGGYPQQQVPVPQSGGPGQRQYGIPSWMQQGTMQSNYSNDQMWQWFQMADTSRNGSISPRELQRALAGAGFTYTIEMCQQMVDMFDMNGSGDIDFQEFKGLFNYIQQMQNAYNQYGSGGYMNSTNIQSALYTHPSIATAQSRGIDVNSVLSSFGSSSGRNLNFMEFLTIALAVGKLLSRSGAPSGGSKYGSSYGQQQYAPQYGQQYGYGAPGYGGYPPQ